MRELDIDCLKRSHIAAVWLVSDRWACAHAARTFCLRPKAALEVRNTIRPIENRSRPTASGIIDNRQSTIGNRLTLKPHLALRSLLVSVAVLSLIAFSGCGNQPPKTPTTADQGVTRTATDGPVSLSLTVRPADLPFDKHAELLVEAASEKGVTVDLADYEREVSSGEHRFEYRLRRIDRRAAQPAPDGKLHWTQRYEIDFFLPGDYELPSASLTYVDTRAATRLPPQPPFPSRERDGVRVEETASDTASSVAAKPVELKTESIKVVARPTEQAKLSPEELKKITVLPPVELREPWSRWWLFAPVGLVALIACLIWLVRRSRREFLEALEVIPAHEWARRQIAELIAADLIAKGLVQEFYYRISAVVRGYIERRYAVSAPEMTTEEFLAAASHDRRFDAPATVELQRFLTACDLVKYARQRPAHGEWDQLLKTASDFVERTREEIPRSTGIAAPAATTLEAATG